MADAAWQRLTEDYPEFVSLRSTLALAAITWPRWGISAGQLAAMGEAELAYVRLLAEEF